MPGPPASHRTFVRTRASCHRSEPTPTLPGLGRIFVGGSGRRFDEISLFTGWIGRQDWSGVRASWGCDNEVSYTGPRQMTLIYNAAPNFDYYRGVTYNDFRHNIDASIRPNGVFTLFLDSSFGHTVDFTNVRHARRARYTVGTDDRALGRLTGDVSVADERLSTEDQQRIYVARITQGRPITTSPRAPLSGPSCSTPTSNGTLQPISSRSRRRSVAYSHNCSSATRSIPKPCF